MAGDDNQVKSGLGKAEMAAQLAEEGFLEAAHFLRQVLDDAPDDFDQTCKLRGIGRRKAYYLAEIDRAFHNLNVDQKRLHRIGWTKLRLIAAHIDAATADAYLTLAEQRPAHELEKLMNNQPVHPKTHTVLLHLSPDQYQLFRKTVLKFGALPSGNGLFNKEEGLAKALAMVLSQEDWLELLDD